MANITTNNSIIPRGAKRLPDDSQWTDKFEIRSESSNRVYVISKNKKSGKYGCSCPGFCIHRKCKHLIGVGLTTLQIHGHDQMEHKKRDVVR